MIDRKRIAIVGSGITGLTCAWLLKDQYHVTLFEAAPRLGGHTNTVDVETTSGKYAVDTGFIVHNDATYPNFVKIMDRLGVKRQDTSMSFSVRCEDTGLEYNGTSINTLFAQRSNLLSPKFWRLIRGIFKFNKLARAFLIDPDRDMTLGKFLENIPAETVRYYVMPMGAAVWSTPLEEMTRFPALFFIRFFENHGFLNIEDRPQWKVIQGGSRNYIAKMTQGLSDQIHTSSPVEQVSSHSQGASLRVSGDTVQFDQVILATHSDQALKLLASPTDAERNILGAIPYTRNVAWLHTDTRFQPIAKRAWASWNYHLSGDQMDKATVTYNMNILQGLKAPETFLVTLNPHHEIDLEHVIRKITYHHPLFTLEGMQAQKHLGEINGRNRIWFCGAWHRNGFHEDGVWSALQTCRQLGVDL